MLNDSSEAKDLGVIISHDLKSHNHIEYIVKKASRVSNLILRSFSSRRTDILLKAFLVYARPLLEYATPAWNPYLLGDIRKIEKVQRRFTKRIVKDKNMSYENRLHLLNIESLELRRLYFDLSLAFSIIMKDSLPFEDFFQLQ